MRKSVHSVLLRGRGRAVADNANAVQLSSRSVRERDAANPLLCFSLCQLVHTTFPVGKKASDSTKPEQRYMFRFLRCSGRITDTRPRGDFSSIAREPGWPALACSRRARWPSFRAGPCCSRSAIFDPTRRATVAHSPALLLRPPRAPHARGACLFGRSGCGRRRRRGPPAHSSAAAHR